MYHQQTEDGKYRAIGNSLYKAQTDEFGQTAYVHVYHNDRIRGIQRLIASYENALDADEYLTAV